MSRQAAVFSLGRRFAQMDPKCAVSRPATRTTHHTRRAAATNLTPREETALFASHEAASRLTVPYKDNVRIVPAITNENFSRNATSATYWVGLVIHSVKPLRTCSTSPTQMAENSRL